MSADVLGVEDWSYLDEEIDWDTLLASPLLDGSLPWLDSGAHDGWEAATEVNAADLQPSLETSRRSSASPKAGAQAAVEQGRPAAVARPPKGPHARSLLSDQFKSGSAVFAGDSTLDCAATARTSSTTPPHK